MPGPPGGESPPPAGALPVLPPHLLGEAVVDYPAGGSGTAAVVLELVIGTAGEVREARIVEGSEPFASAAVSAAARWHFEPARRGALAVAARIRFQLRFVEPERVPLPQPEAVPEPASPHPTPAPLPAPIEVTVAGRRAAPLAQSLTRAEVRQLPGAFGDAFRAIEALPGVTPIASGVPFFYVRGAPPGNVGYFLDGIRLPLLFHVGLGPSVVHPALLSQVDLYPGAYPTRYGRFSGGIVAGEVNEPGEQLWGEWQLRLFDAGAIAEAPFAEGRGHVLLGGRYSYTAYLISLLGKNVRLEYWDYQARASYRFGEADTLGVFVFGSFDYFGRDTRAANDDLFSTEFHRIDLRYRHVASAHSEFSAGLTLGEDRTRVAEQGGAARNHRVQLRSEYETRLSPSLELRVGADAALDDYRIEPTLLDQVNESPPPRLDPNAPVTGELPAPAPTSSEASNEEQFRRLFPSRRDEVVGAYGELAWDAAPGVRVVSGVRSDVYASDGVLALSIEPRVSAEFRISDRLTLKHGLGLAAQPPSFVVPVAGFEIGGLPGGLQRSVQSSAGLVYALPEGMTLGLTAFHNVFFNTTDVLSLVRTDAVENLQADTRTQGQAYGLELLFHRDLTRRLGGFLAYTLSRSLRSTSIGNVPSSFDRTHVLNAALGYDLGHHFRLGGRFMFYTGSPSFESVLRGAPNIGPSDPAGGDSSSEVSRAAPGPGSRLPAFHRLDLRIEKRWPFGDAGGFSALVLEVLNSTLSKEVVSRSCDTVRCQEQAIGPVTIPSLSFEGRF